MNARTSWVRVESSTLDPDMVEGLSARVADPLWLLARQWQVGEFTGEDAANPLLVRLSARSVVLDRLVLHDGTVHPLRPDQPPEPLVERETVVEGPSGVRASADLGRMLVRALRRGLGARSGAASVEALQSRYPVQVPDDDGLDPAGMRRLRLLARDGLDGVAVLRDLESGVDVAGEASAGAPSRAQQQVRRLLAQWETEARQMVSDPALEPGADVGSSPPAWRSGNLEYAFRIEGRAAQKDLVLAAEEYHGGRLDWYAVDRVDEAGSGEDRPDSTRRTRDRLVLLPTPLRFRGMPAARFWEFEDGEVFFGALPDGPADLARAAVATYGTVYGDDWLVVPLRVPVGTLAQVTELEVLDDFGDVTTIPPAAVVDSDDRTERRAFQFFEQSGDPGPAAGLAPGLFVPASVEVADAGHPLEDVRFSRDEGANLAWAAEERIESVAGRPVDLAARLAQAMTGRSGSSSDDGSGGGGQAGREGEWRLRLSTDVPDHWVPPVPVRVDGGGPAFQRGRVPVGPGERTRGARGRVLEPERRLLVRDAEIPSVGLRVVRRYQSARGPDGALYVWVGRRKGPGRPQGESDLRFDVLETGP